MKHIFSKETTLAEFVRFIERAGCCGIRRIFELPDGSIEAAWDGIDFVAADQLTELENGRIAEVRK